MGKANRLYMPRYTNTQSLTFPPHDYLQGTSSKTAVLAVLSHMHVVVSKAVCVDRNIRIKYTALLLLFICRMSRLEKVCKERLRYQGILCHRKNFIGNLYIWILLIYLINLHNVGFWTPWTARVFVLQEAALWPKRMQIHNILMQIQIRLQIPIPYNISIQ